MGKSKEPLLVSFLVKNPQRKRYVTKQILRETTSKEPLLVSFLVKNPRRKRSVTKQILRETILRETTSIQESQTVWMVQSNVPTCPKQKRKRESISNSLSKRKKLSKPKALTTDLDEVEWTTRFLGEPIPVLEAKNNWPDRYNAKEEKRKLEANRLKKKKKDGEHEEMIVQAKQHFKRAIVDEQFEYELNDDSYVQSSVEDVPYICKIVELFEGVDGNCYFTAQWFYRTVDTVINEPYHKLINDKRVFFSEVRDTNPLCTLRKKLKIAMISLNETTPPSGEYFDYFCNMKYLIPFSTFEALPPSTTRECSTIATETEVSGGDATMSDAEEAERRDATLLDLYSGCGAMSTGLTMGAELAGLKLVTKWAVDKNEHACKSMQHNHPETRVRQGEAEDFLSLVKEWKKLCVYFSLEKGGLNSQGANPYGLTNAVDRVSRKISVVLDICFGDPKDIQQPGLYFKVAWLDRGVSSHDTWEPIHRLRNCKDMIQEFVEWGHKSNILPLPGAVDVICGGPPCQGISGHNRYRKSDNPLQEDDKNHQLVVFMDIVRFLKPKYVLMENVVDILKFVKGEMARYAVGRLIQMNYQTRMGMMAAGAYGLAQYRMRFFLWGARSNEALPTFPLPTHDVQKRGSTPLDFSSNLVAACDEGHTMNLAPKLLLKDMISDLPEVKNSEKREEMPYGEAPQTPFQEFIRLSKNETVASPSEKKLCNHTPLNLNRYDYLRVKQIPKKKGACFRDLRGVKVGANNVVRWDRKIKRIYLAPKRPLVPYYAMRFRHGKSHMPFGRLWWDETVSTVVTRAEPHNQIIIHPEQDRVLTIRENMRLQGFPDHYKLYGPTKAKYCQVGNAVAVPVGRALGYALGKAFMGLSNGNPLMTLPKGFPVLKDDESSGISS